MEISSSAATTLTRPRFGITVITVAAAASISYFLYRAVYDPPLPSPPPGAGLHRSNAVRRRRRSVPERRERRASDASSWTSAESHGDENADLLRPLNDGETVAEDPTMVVDDDDWNDASNMPHPRAGQNIVSLLFRVSEDNARRNAYVHRGCACNACGIVPIRGIRYRCANCADFDLCETCESQGLHIKTHIFYKVKVPAPPFGPRQMQPVWYPGDPDTCLRNLPRHLMAKLSRETGFERPELEAFWEQWTFMANTEWREDPDDLCLAMDRPTFERCLVPSRGYRHTAPNLIHERMFAFYDTNNDDLIGFSEFLHGVAYRKRKDKLQKIFDGYDVDGDGYVSRRDFLRIFRAYYVLYKQMHKDILEGLDEQVMSTTEAHQLITSRQPLSSLFGREGRFPSADNGRPMEGKIFHSNGDVAIGDGRSEVVNEDRPDVSEREVILSTLYSKDEEYEVFDESLFPPVTEAQPSGIENDPRYLDGLFNPPRRVDDLVPLLRGHPRENPEISVTSEAIDASTNDASESADGDDSEPENHSGPQVNSEPQNGTAADIQFLDGNDSETRLPTGYRGHVASPEDFTTRIPTESQLRRQHQAIAIHSQRINMSKRSRVTARRKLLERWKRRQFYLDEEEGAVRPDGWNDEDDVLAHMNGAAESSKAAQHGPMSPRSRSSSKVRFAEDDDYEVRSNPSTSSRSVPERWGGMDIADAERDAGKEILYQVSQQAFNELLDMLFKEKEDLAVQVAATREMRNKHRPLFELIDLEEEDKPAGAPKGKENVPLEKTSTNDMSADELPKTEDWAANKDAAKDEQENSGSSDSELEQQMREVFEAIDASAEVGASGAAENTDSTVASGRRDPTMPQFRPNSLSESFASEMSASGSSSSGFVVLTPASDTAKGKSTASKGKASALQPVASSSQGSSDKTESAFPTPIPRSTLVQWKRLDVAEEEAKERGGWGRLSLAEFEDIHRRSESQAHRLDYLGSWIDFCIP